MLHRIRYGTRPDGVVVPDRAVYHKVPGKGGTPPDSSSAATSPPSRCAPPNSFSFLYPPTASADSALTATAAPQADWTTPAFHARASRFATAIATPRRSCRSALKTENFGNGVGLLHLKSSATS